MNFKLIAIVAIGLPPMATFVLMKIVSPKQRNLRPLLPVLHTMRWLYYGTGMGLVVMSLSDGFSRFSLIGVLFLLFDEIWGFDEKWLRRQYGSKDLPEYPGW